MFCESSRKLSSSVEQLRWPEYKIDISQNNKSANKASFPDQLTYVQLDDIDLVF